VPLLFLGQLWQMVIDSFAGRLLSVVTPLLNWLMCWHVI